MSDAVTMGGVVLAGFRGAATALEKELQVMPLDRWSESVLRYHFCHAVAEAYPATEQYVECAQIDLVLAWADLRAFVEFKHYWHARRHDPYTSHQCGFKGGPSLKNLREFQACVEQLAERPAMAGLSKFVVLFYADRDEESRRKWTYGKHYDDYRHEHPTVILRPVESWGPVKAGGGIVRASLFEVSVAGAPDGA